MAGVVCLSCFLSGVSPNLVIAKFGGTQSLSPMCRPLAWRAQRGNGSTHRGASAQPQAERDLESTDVCRWQWSVWKWARSKCREFREARSS